ncbi:MAG: hypothetical protein JXA66_02480 [Oligoflexia bacterium]|nr:hypothetical protein [Oligoflexia bacterium]
MYSHNDFVSSLLALFNFLFNSYIFVYVSAQKIRTRINKAFLLQTGFISMWALADYINRMPIEIEYKQTVSLFAQLLYIPTGLLFMNIIYIFINRKYDYIFYGILVVDIIFAYLGISKKLIVTDIIATSAGTVIVKGPLFQPFLLLCEVLPTLIAITLIFNISNKGKNSKYRKPIIYITGGATVSILSSLLIHYTGIAPVGSFSLVFFSLSIFLAVYNHDFMGLSAEDAVNELLSCVYDGIVITDESGIISHINEKASGLLGIAGINYKFRFGEILANYGISLDMLKTDREHKFTVDNRSVKRDVIVSYSEIKSGNIVKGNIFIIKEIR